MRHLFQHLAQFDPIIAALDADKPQPDDPLIRKLDHFEDLLKRTAVERFKDWVPPLFTPEGVLDAEAVHAIFLKHRRQWEGLSWDWLGWTIPTPYWTGQGDSATPLPDDAQKKSVNRHQLIANVGEELYDALYQAYSPRRRIPARLDLDVASPAGRIKCRHVELNTRRTSTKALQLRARILSHYFGRGKYAFVPKRDMDDEAYMPLRVLLPLHVPPAPHPPQHKGRCTKCQGLLTHLREYGYCGVAFSVLRCVNCGYRIYPH